MAKTDPRTATPRTAHLIGWTAVLGVGNAEATAAKVDRALDAFLGDYGRIRVTGARDGFGFGFWKPETPLPMTTWSSFSDARFVGFVEGIFYDDYGSHHIAEGDDPRLAPVLVESFAVEGEHAIGRLSGSFAGFVFDAETRQLTTFVDRLGTRSVYWTQAQGETIVSSNLASFRGVAPSRLDPGSAFQFLTIGFPIGERTLLDGIFIQAPGTVRSFSAGIGKESRYWTPPERQETMKLWDAVARIVGSMEDCVARISRRSRGSLGLGLTGGHDSRVIFGSLLHKDISFEAVSWREHSFNDRVALELSARAGKRHILLPDPSAEDLAAIQKHAFVYTDGQYLHAYGFTRLGQQCSIEGLGALIVGFSGDMLSGSAPVAWRSHAGGIDRLARSALRAQMEHLSFRDAETLLTGGGAGNGAGTMSLWMKSFEEESWRGSMSDISIWQRLRNRNFKRIRQAMNPALQYVQLLYPYVDNSVLDVYFSLPVRFLDQTPHCYAGFYRFPRFGDLPAGGVPISLRNEARFPLGVYLPRLAKVTVQTVRSRLRRAPDRSEWSPAEELTYREVAESPLFDSRRLDELVRQRRVNAIALRKMRTLDRFDRFYVRGDDSMVPADYLSGRD